MKLKMVAISVVVSVSLVAGVGYGAYYAMKGKTVPVEVVPVSNVNAYYGWGGDDSTIYGSITSRAAQTVVLNDNYDIEDIYVEEGDYVKEGTPLFSYDMTLPELELEMAELNLQSQELTMVRLEKDLEKLKNTKATASLDGNRKVRTMASEDEIVEEIAEYVPETADEVDELSEDGAQSEAGDANDTSASGNKESADGELIVEDVTVQEYGSDGEDLTVRNSVSGYEQLIQAIDVLIQTHGDTIEAADIGGAITEAVGYYRKHLAQEKRLETEGETSVSALGYVLRDEVRAALSEEEYADLEAYAEKMNRYHVYYVELLIAELDPENPGDFGAAVKEARKEYENLVSAAKAQVTGVERLAEMEKLADTDSGQGNGETEISSETGAPSETETESEKPDESETGSEKPGESETESETEQESETEVFFYVTAVNGVINGTGQSEMRVYPGETVTITAQPEQELQTFAGWSVTPQEVVLEDASAETTTFVMPEADVRVEALYDEKLSSYVDAFLALAEAALGADGVTLESYSPADLKTAIDFYQANLADESEEIVDGSTAKMEGYVLRPAFAEFLNANGKEHEVSYLPQRYKQLCMTYVKTLIENLNPRQLDRDSLQTARNAYDSLGANWRAELDASVVQVSVSQDPAEQGKDQVSYNGQTSGIETGASEPEENAGESDMTEGDPEGTGSEAESGTQTPTSVTLTYGELLDAYEIILEIQEIEPYLSGPTELLVAYLTQVRDGYLALSDAQKTVVWNSDVLIGLLQQYGLWESPAEPTVPDFGGGDDMGGFGDEGYTAQELQELIQDKEREIKECELNIREAKLNVNQQQRVVDGKVVKSTMEGTVVAIGTKDGSSEDEYFAKVVNETGLFARGVMNELALEQIKVGDTISGQTDDNVMFTAVIKEISEYPDSSGSSYSMGMSENTNASYYPFYALLDDTEGIMEGGATIQLSGEAMTSDENAIYLENYFIRTENDGRSYVYKQGEDGNLTKQYVSTGKSLWGYATEIVSGLSKSDRIAFPYGDHVFEGASTEEVDQLEDAYS